MIDAKADLSIKFSEMPNVSSEGKKNVALTFKTAIGTVICNVKSKTYRKAVSASEGFDTWIAAISGKDLSDEGGVITMSGCGIQVFEKKQKTEAKTEKPVEIAKPIKDKKEHPKTPEVIESKEHTMGGKRVFVPDPAQTRRKVRKPDQPTC